MSDERMTIRLAACVIEQAEWLLPHLVAEARVDGCSWEQVAGRLGTSVERVGLRFDPDSPVADTRWVRDA